MKVLAVSDQVVEIVYSSRIRQRFGDVEMVFSCGDLPCFYLEYISSMLNVPCFFVHGNHDVAEYSADGRLVLEPGGWVNLDGRIVRSSAKGRTVLIGGLEGSQRYKPHAPFQYTEREMTLKVWRMALSMMVNRLRFGRYLDVLITHAPPFGIHDGADLPHQGFSVFLKLMRRFRPRYLLHGHKHIYGLDTWRTCFGETEVINVYPYRLLELEL